MFLDDSACNLASINLLKFLTDVIISMFESFEHAIGITILAQEIICRSCILSLLRKLKK